MEIQRENFKNKKPRSGDEIKVTDDKKSKTEYFSVEETVSNGHDLRGSTRNSVKDPQPSTSGLNSKGKPKYQEKWKVVGGRNKKQPKSSNMLQDHRRWMQRENATT